SSQESVDLHDLPALIEVDGLYFRNHAVDAVDGDGSEVGDAASNSLSGASTYDWMEEEEGFVLAGNS
ncbi:unnamed protein product, partial [Amoebophrya sp. A25]